MALNFYGINFGAILLSAFIVYSVISSSLTHPRSILRPL